jgi:uncharacterized membrane protein (UPF0127 family)
MIKKISGLEIANSPISKTLGLIGRKDFRGYNGMLLKNANAIHTFFVRFPIDVVFLDRDFKVLKIVEKLSPFHFSPIVWKAKHTLELPKGSIKKYSLKVGTQIDLS